MRARVEAFSPRVLMGVAIGAVLLYAAVAWFLVVSPKRADASEARVELQVAQNRLADAELALAQVRSTAAPVVDVFRLAKAMPRSTEESSLLLELTSLAKASGVTVKGITSQAPIAAVGGPTLIPVSVTVGGRYHGVTRFLERARLLVTVSDGKIAATGRLLSAQSVTLTESDTGKFPELDATVAFHAYVYDAPIEAVEPPDTGTEEEDPSTGTSAAGSTP